MEQAVTSFLQTVLRSRLLTREQLEEALRGVPRTVRDTPEALATHLVKSGKLSRFQADKLLKGTALGLLVGPYQVLAPIGKGGMGTVYLARDSRSGQLLALKVLPPKRARLEQRLLARFQREMKMNYRVAHPHIAWTYEADNVGNIHYIAMEFIPGRSLSRMVSEEGPLPVRRAAHLFAEVCAALEHAHERGLIHRDLKPSNIMITPNNHAKLLDLGLALDQDDTSADREVIGGAGYIVGSMDWIAPEQTTDATAVDARSDIYGMGCTMYYALSGRPPFPGGTNREKIHRHRREEPVRLEVLNPAVPSLFASLVHKMMAKNPAQRFQSAAAVRAQLLPWVTEDELVLPLDCQGDTNFHRAVTQLQVSEFPSELIEVVGSSSAGLADPWARTPAAAPSDRLRDYLWIGIGLVGFWVVLLGILGLVMLFR